MKENRVTLKGTIKDFVFSHEWRGTRYYTATVTAKRFSGQMDEVKVLVPESIVSNPDEFKADDRVMVHGCYCSRRDKENHLHLYVYADEFGFAEDDGEDINEIELEAVIKRDAIYRVTPLGRKIADMLITAKTSGGKAYIPCIAWKENAVLASTMKPGDRIQITGRMQSRVYQKKNAEDQCEDRVAYEVSIAKMEKVS